MLPTGKTEAVHRPLRILHDRSVTKSPELATPAVYTVPSVMTTSPAPIAEAGKKRAATTGRMTHERFPLQSGKP